MINAKPITYIVNKKCYTDFFDYDSEEVRTDGVDYFESICRGVFLYRIRLCDYRYTDG
jgi:hypothetical protein